MNRTLQTNNTIIEKRLFLELNLTYNTRSSQFLDVRKSFMKLLENLVRISKK